MDLEIVLHECFMALRAVGDACQSLAQAKIQKKCLALGSIPTPEKRKKEREREGKSEGQGGEGEIEEDREERKRGGNID